MLTTQAEPWIPFEPDIMEIEGRLDSATAPGMEEDALLCIQSGARRLVLDCSRLFYVTAAGLRSMLALARAMKETGGRFAVCGLQPQVEDMFENSGLDAIITVYDTPDHAIAALAA
jgi:stage II sporulation protein AA (anti-sigma F factor antagonist)